MSKFSIAGLQLEAAHGNNLGTMEAEIELAVKRFPWLDMVVLAELNAFGSRTEHAQPLPGPAEQRFCETARRLGIWLLPGSLFERAGERIYNTAPVINPDGEVVARHRKQFPWLPYEQGVSAGEDFVVFDVPDIGRFGVSICYDMWFPETIRTLAWMGAEVILHPSLTSTIDRHAELAIVRSHAAINQCYFIDVNLAGPLGVGESCIAGPGGELIYQAGKGREIIPLTIDLNYVRDVRENGWHNLGQPLKSFRDSKLRFPPYLEGQASPALAALGPMKRAASRGGSP
ncbi:MAG: carbon-nitrogen hydrolase family protein [Gammaproteobacteria bacterium]|nr:carbon-nitrogen hydrolase family protein [Gammaproteobacteria bacterium]